MRYIVVVADLDEQNYYLPVVEAPGVDEALQVAQSEYQSCVPVAALTEQSLEYALNVIRSGAVDCVFGGS